MATLGQEEVEIPSVSQRKMVRSIAICVVQVYLSGLPLLKHSIQLSPAAELSGKDHEDSSHTVVIAVVHWYLLTLGQNCERGNLPLAHQQWLVLTASGGPSILCLLACYHQDTRTVQKAPRTLVLD